MSHYTSIIKIIPLVIQQVLTPPQRPQTQSPVGPGIMQQISQPMPHQFMPTYTVMPPTVVNQAPQPSQQRVKRGRSF